MPQQVWIDRAARCIALCRPLSELFFVLRGALAGDDFFLFDLSSFFFQLGFRGFDLFFAGLGVRPLYPSDAADE